MSELLLNPAKTALVLIDLQNGIVGRDTKPYAAGEIVERSARMAEALRIKGGVVVYVRVDLGDFLDLSADEVHGIPKDIPAAASEIAPTAGMQAGDLLITKRHWAPSRARALKVNCARGASTRWCWRALPPTSAWNLHCGRAPGLVLDS